MLKKLLIITAITLSATGAYSQEEKKIVLVADEWCPYNCAADIENKGYMVEIAKEVFEPKGIKVEYDVIPWERAIEEARKGTYTGIIGARIGDAPDFIFPEEALGLSTNTFYVNQDSDWVYKGVESLKNVSLGVIEGYSYEEKLDDYIKKNSDNPDRVQSIAADSAVGQNFNKLEKGRIDVVVEDCNVVNLYMAQNNMAGKFKDAGEEKGGKGIKEQYVYIAFSPVNKSSAEYAKMLSDGMKELRKSGKLKEILSKYSVIDWVK